MQQIGCLYRLEPNKEAKVTIFAPQTVMDVFFTCLDVPTDDSNKQRRSSQATDGSAGGPVLIIREHI